MSPSATFESHIKQLPLSLRRNRRPVQCRDWLLLMLQEHAACTLIELRQIGTTPSSPDSLLEDAPETFNRVAVVATAGRQAIHPQLLVPVGERRCQFVRPVYTAAVGDHDNFLCGFAEGRHDLMEIWAPRLGVTMGHDFVEDFRSAILDGTEDAAQHPIGHAAPTPIATPCLAFQGLFTCDVAGAEGPCGQAIALRFAVPPTCAGQGKTPQDRCIFVEQNDLTALGAIRQCRQCERRPRQRRGVRSEPPRGAAVAAVCF
jgi:hypothetical protein